MSSLDRVLALNPVGEGSFTAHIDENWMQGRTAYGGLSAALALQAALDFHPEAPPLKCAQISFIGPVSGDCAIQSKLVRESKSSRFISSEVTSEAGFGTQALFTFTGERASHVELVDLPMPDVPAPETLESLPFNPMRPRFTTNFDMRPVDGPEFKIGQDVAHMLTWVRFNEQPSCNPAVALLALGDALPPAAMTLFTQFGPLSSMNWTVNMLSQQPATRDGWWLLESRSHFVRGGFSAQEMMLWNRDGEPIASGGQAVGIYV